MYFTKNSEISYTSVTDFWTFFYKYFMQKVEVSVGSFYNHCNS